MPIEINHTADKFKCVLSNIDKILEQLKNFPDSLDTGASSKEENECFTHRDD